MDVKYDNQLNKLDLKSWKPVELNMFFTIVAKLRNQKSNLVTISKDEFIKLSNYQRKVTDEEFCNDVKLTIKKIYNLGWSVETDTDIDITNFFARLNAKIERINQPDFIRVRVNSEFEEVFSLQSGFTLFELRQLVMMKSAYSKNMFRFLKQWKSKGRRYFTIGLLRTMLGIPDTYSNAEITRNVINAIKNDFKSVDAFDCFSVTPKKIKRVIVGYTFSWTPETKFQQYHEPDMPDWYYKSEDAYKPPEPELLIQVLALQNGLPDTGKIYDMYFKDMMDLYNENRCFDDATPVLLAEDLKRRYPDQIPE